MNTGSPFAGKVVWITGAASGQGLRHAHRFAEAGASVGCLDVNGEGADRLVEEIQSRGGRAEAVATDVSDWGSVSNAAARLEAALGPADVVVANAGVVPTQVAAVEELDPAVWDRVFAVNSTGAFHTAKAAIPQLKARGGGAIVFISSVAGLRGFPSYSSYVASKHAVIGLMRALANELATDNIRVNAVCPGTVDTPILGIEAENFGVSREDLVAEQVRMHLFERLVEPDEISDAVLWLTSDAASMITGVTLPVDGGFVEKCSLT